VTVISPPLPVALELVVVETLASPLTFKVGVMISTLPARPELLVSADNFPPLLKVTELGAMTVKFPPLPLLEVDVDTSVPSIAKVGVLIVTLPA
jgi:hypothetical protein